MPTKAAVFLAALAATAACAAPATRPLGDPTTPGVIPPAGTATASPAHTVTPSPSPTKTSPPPAAGETLTEEDAGTTVTLKVGESVRVSLPSDYHRPEAQGTSVERTAASGGYPTGSPATATFTAVAKGNAEISSTTDYACLHATPSCALPQQLWSVQIRVV